MIQARLAADALARRHPEHEFILVPLATHGDRHPALPLTDSPREGVFVKEDPGYLARMFTVMDQVLLSDWVAGGMKAGCEELVRRLGAMVERAFCRVPEQRPRRS